jgi:hypothetical protein
MVAKKRIERQLAEDGCRALSGNSPHKGFINYPGTSFTSWLKARSRRLK